MSCKLYIYKIPFLSFSITLYSKTHYLLGQFLRGIFDKIGIEPQVKRIGKYKSAGDQLLRKDMAEF